MTTRANRIERYYDSHEVEGEELGQSAIHLKAILYLVAVLEWLHSYQPITILADVNFYQTDNSHETPKCPDVAVVERFEGDLLADEDGLPSYYVGQDGPAPRIVFEVSSASTWKVDLEEKPAMYQTLGVSEYIAFDPHTRTVWTKEWRKSNRLIGWRRNPLTGQFVQIEKDEQGRLWSEELQSWLAVEGRFLRLYDENGQRRLTEAEFKTRLVETQRAQSEAERVINRAERSKLEAEKVKAEAETQAERIEAEARVQAEKTRAETEKARAETEKARAEKLAEFLRAQGFNPDDVG